MPVEVMQRCQYCHALLIRSSSFRSTMLPGTPTSTRRRVWSSYCRVCEENHPGILKEIAAELDPSDHELERGP